MRGDVILMHFLVLVPRVPGTSVLKIKYFFKVLQQTNEEDVDHPLGIQLVCLLQTGVWASGRGEIRWKR